MISRDVDALARELFTRIATQPGVIASKPEGELLSDLLCARALTFDDRAALIDASRRLAERCRLAASEALPVLHGLGAARVRPPRRYECPECRSADVELCFPVWVRANDIDDQDSWQLDLEAQPEKDSERGFCPWCESHVLVRKVEEVPHGS